MSTKLYVVTAAYNCQDYISTCLEMLSLQTYENWGGIVIDDASSDLTPKIIQERCPSNMKYILNSKRVCELDNQYPAIMNANLNDEDVIVIVDGDDWLYAKDSLAKLALFYEDLDVWMTYGSFQIFPSGKRGKDSRPVPKGYDFRKDQWVLSHLRTYKYFLFKNIFEEDLRSSTGEFFNHNTDTATMKPMAEMAGWDHIKYIHDFLLVYNSANPLGEGKSEDRRRVSASSGKEIYNKPRYKTHSKQELIDGIKDR